MVSGAFVSLRQLMAGIVHYAGRRRMIVTLLLMLLGAVLEGVGLAMLVPLVSVLTDTGGAGASMTARLLDQVGIDTPFGRLAALLGCFVVVLLLRAITLMTRDRHINALQIGFIEHERLRVIGAVAHAEWEQVSGLRHARVVNALTVNIQRVAGSVQLIMQVLVMAIMLLVQLALTLALAPVVAAIILAALLIGMLRLSISIRRGLRQGRKIGEGQLALTETAARLLGGLKVATAEQAQGAFVKAFATTSLEMSTHQLCYQRDLSRFRALVSTGIAIAGAGMLLLGFWVQGATASLLAAFLIVSRMAAPAVALYQNIERIATLLPAHAEIHQLGQELGSMASGGGDDGTAPEGAIELENASYVHNDGSGVRDLTLRIDPGEFIGIVGASGSGKTTLIDLLATLYRPQQGRITVGGVPLDAARSAAWRARIAYVGQEAFLANDTLRANLVWGCEPQSDTALWKALEQTQIADTVRAMPLGLDTVVSERGLRLSGGERQRIALARALLRRPNLLILDEATNAIDIKTEHSVIAGLTAMHPRPTILIVAHRTETLRLCTRQISVAAGRVVEDRQIAPSDGAYVAPHGSPGKADR